MMKPRKEVVFIFSDEGEAGEVHLTRQLNQELGIGRVLGHSDVALGQWFTMANAADLFILDITFPDSFSKEELAGFAHWYSGKLLVFARGDDVLARVQGLFSGDIVVTSLEGLLAGIRKILNF